MPTLDLGDWNAGIGKYTCHCIWAAMCFPDDLPLRQQYLKKKVIEWKFDMKDSVIGGTPLEEDENPFVQAIIEIKAEEFSFSLIDEAFKKYLLRTGGDQVTLNTLSQDKSIDSIENASLYGGFTSGLVLFKIFQLDRHYMKESSINKAIYLAGEFYKLAANIPNSETSIKNAWSKFKKVSHFWAAAVFLFDEFKGKNSFGLIEWFELDPQKNLLQFLGCAEYYRKLGEKHLPNEATTVTTLDPKESWVLPEEFPIQKRLPRVPKLQNWEIEALENYKALPHQ